MFKIEFTFSEDRWKTLYMYIWDVGTWFQLFMYVSALKIIYHFN